jgi:hypothetical protein
MFAMQHVIDVNDILYAMQHAARFEIDVNDCTHALKHVVGLNY